MWVRERDSEKSRTGKRDGQPQLSASLNVLTVHLNISMCHHLFVSPDMCLFACVFCRLGGGDRPWLWLWLWLPLPIGNPRASCPQGHFLLLAHLPGNPTVTLWPLRVCISPDKRVSVETASFAYSPNPSVSSLLCS